MKNELANIFLERIRSGLVRTAITKPSTWSENYRIMGQPYPGKWTFDHHPWLKEMHDATDEFISGMKAAQMGFTETGLNITFANMDINQYSVLYVLPNQNPDATDFSASRFDPAIEMSDHLQSLFSHVKNVGHKRAGSANLFIRGSRSESAMKSNPCPIVIFDEMDEMVQENIVLAYERASGQNFSQFWHFSTPTVTTHGIANLFNGSDKSQFVFKCPNCGVWTHIPCPDGLVVNEDDPELSYLQTECRHQLNNDAKIDFLNLKHGSHWIKTVDTKVNGRGFWIPQLYSMAKACRPGAIARSTIKARIDPAEEQQLWNSKYGLPFERAGSRITDSEIEQCKSQYQKPKIQTSGIITMGVDVGKWLHYEIDHWYIEHQGPDLHANAIPTVLDEGKVEKFEDLDKLMRQRQIKYCVIDANPERRKAMEFSLRFNGFVNLCFYARGLNSKKDITTSETAVSIDRTSWMDIALGRFEAKRIVLPSNLSDEYTHMLKIPVRIYEKDKDGNPIGRYVGEGDHGAHARVYNEVALLFAASMSTNRDIRAFL